MKRRIVAALAVSVLLALGGSLAWLLALRPARDARLLEAHRMPIAAPAADVLTATWFGTTAVLLRVGDDALMIDPFFTRPQGLWPLIRNVRIAPDESEISRWLQQAGVERLHAVLVSHSHYDHAMDAGVVARRTAAVLVGSPSTANIGRGAGLDEAQIRVPEGRVPLQLGPFRVRFVESRHAGATGGAPTGDIEQPLTPPTRYLDYRQGGTYSILVEHPLGAVLHHGSAGHVAGALRGLHADTVLLGAALVEEPDRYRAEVVDAVNARRVVLVHWDDFTRSLDQPLRPMPLVVNLGAMFDTLARRPDLQVAVPALGEPFALSPDQ